MNDDTSIKLLCPNTNRPVSTGMDLGGDAALTRDTGMSGNAFQCSACGEMHRWEKPAGETMGHVVSEVE